MASSLGALLLLLSLALVSSKYVDSNRAEEARASLEFKLNKVKAARSLNGTLTVPFSFPLYLQCDDAWGDDIMDTKTICSVGCLMTSTSMALSGSGIAIAASGANAQTLNTWLKANGGYDGSNDLEEGVVPNIDPSRISWPADAMHKTNDLSYATVSSYLSQGRIVIANVMAGRHFVLLTGFSSDGDTFVVNDPGFNVDSYSYKTDVVGYRIFDMVRS